jgi:hypothetical protein
MRLARIVIVLLRTIGLIEFVTRGFQAVKISTTVFFFKKHSLRRRRPHLYSRPVRIELIVRPGLLLAKVARIEGRCFVLRPQPFILV